jgi:hypothetical protein
MINKIHAKIILEPGWPVGSEENLELLNEPIDGELMSWICSITEALEGCVVTEELKTPIFTELSSE